MATRVVQPPVEGDCNGWADHWRNRIGINVIPWNKGISNEGINRSKRVFWTDWQDKPIPQELHDYWKRHDMFKDGIARIPGICWHKKPFDAALRWWEADIDKQSAIDAITTINGKKTTIEELSKIFIVEGHGDDPTRLHIGGYYLSDKPYPNVGPGNVCELKCDGKHGIVRCTNSIHYFKDEDGKFIERGHRYVIKGTIEATISNWFVEHILGICNVSAANTQNGDGENKPSLASTLWKDGATVNEGENRHASMLSIMDSLLIKFPNENSEVIFQMAMLKNRLLCKDRDGKHTAPIPESELRTMFEQCKEFARKKLKERVSKQEEQKSGGDETSNGGGPRGDEKTRCSYPSEDTNKQHLEYLERPVTILREGERHNGLKTLGISWFYRDIGEWIGMTDEQRFERLKTYNEKQCKPPKPEQELADLWEWIKQKHTGSRQEQWDKREDDRRNNDTESNPVIISQLSGNMHYQINNNPPTFIMADRIVKRLIEIVFRTYHASSRRNAGGESVTLNQSIHTKSYLACIPDKIIIHKSPIDSIIKDGERYTIHFVGSEQSACRIIRHKTISEIVSELKQSGNVLADFGVEIALSAIIKDFERKGLLEESNDIELVGFLIDDNGNLIASNININKPNMEEISAALKCIDEITKYYAGRLDLLSTLTKWGIVAPVAFAYKQNNSRFLNWLVLWGFTNATKSSSGKYVLAFDGHHNDPDYVLGSGSIDTVARLGDTISKSTFPKLIDEVDLSSIYMKDIINYMKTAIESKIFRTKFMNSKDRFGTRILALSPLILTSNSPPPIHNSAFMRRIIDRSFPQSESCKKTDQMSIDFEYFMRINFGKLKALGDFRNWFIMNNKEMILDKEISPLHLAGKILAEAYQYASIPIPEWFKEGLSETQLEESLSDNSVDVKHAFEAYITSNFDHALSYFRSEKLDKNDVTDLDLNSYKKISSRLIKLIESNRLAHIKRDKSGNILVYRGILEELYKFGLTKDQIPNLRALADYLGVEYGIQHGYRVVKCTANQLESYFDSLPGESR